jgi:hypothetical protein
LQGGECRQGEFVRVGSGRETAKCVHLPQADPDRVFPAPEASRDGGSGLRLGLGYLAAEGSDRAAALAVEVALVLDDEVAPGAEAVKGAEVELLLAGDDRAGLVVDHGPDEGELVVEVVIKLRAADVRGRPHVLDRRGRDAAIEDQPGGGVDDPLAGLPALTGQPARFRGGSGI